MLNKIVVKLSKPNDLMMREPNVDMPPLAILRSLSAEKAKVATTMRYTHEIEVIATNHR